jgi:hypothetical protein
MADPKPDKPERVEIGFSGGQVMSARLTAAQLKDLRVAVERADGWHDVETDDGSVTLDLGQVVFVRTTRPLSGIGFSGS